MQMKLSTYTQFPSKNITMNYDTDLPAWPYRTSRTM